MSEIVSPEALEMRAKVRQRHCNCSTQLGHYLSTGSRLTVTIKHGKLEIDYDSYGGADSFKEDIAIPFCPACGRDISEDKPSEVDEMTLSEIYLKCEQHGVAGYRNLNLNLLTSTVEELLKKENAE